MIFFDQCPHRMACAKCSFYPSKNSTKARLLEANANALRLRQDIPMAKAELSAVVGGGLPRRTITRKIG
jgi:hypothetical protein